MIRTIRNALILIPCALGAATVCAQSHNDTTWGMAMSTGHGTAGTNAYRLSLSKTYGPTWFEDKTWSIHFIWENSIGRWRAPLRAGVTGPRTLAFGTTGPMFRIQKMEPVMGLVPYIEGGVAASLLTEKRIGNRQLALHFQFEDKAGIGIRFGKEQRLDATFRLYHYSNASLNSPNSGMNLYMVSLGYWFPTQ